MNEPTLIKEITTIETEKYGENGNIKEKTREVKERIYSTDYSEEEIKKAKVTDKKKKTGTNPPPKPQQQATTQTQAKTIDEQIQAAANAIDEQKNQAPQQTQPQAPADTQTPFQTWQQQQQQIPQYNVVNRAAAAAQQLQNPTKFPWEQNQ